MGTQMDSEVPVKIFFILIGDISFPLVHELEGQDPSKRPVNGLFSSSYDVIG